MNSTKRFIQSDKSFRGAVTPSPETAWQLARGVVWLVSRTQIAFWQAYFDGVKYPNIALPSRRIFRAGADA